MGGSSRHLYSFVQHYRRPLVVVAIIALGYVIEWATTWQSGDTDVPPLGFAVLERAGDGLRLGYYQDHMPSARYYIPKHLQNYKFGDKDTAFSVKYLSAKEQEVTLTYELGLLNHPRVTYLVSPRGVEPLTVGYGGLHRFAAYLMICFAAAASVALLLVVRLLGVPVHGVAGVVRWVRRSGGPDAGSGETES